MLSYIWTESWGLRQAMRFALNGYDYLMVAKMAVMSFKEFKYNMQH